MARTKARPHAQDAGQADAPPAEDPRRQDPAPDAPPTEAAPAQKPPTLPRLRLVALAVAPAGSLPRPADQVDWAGGGMPARTMIRVVVGTDEATDVRALLRQAADDAAQPLLKLAARLRQDASPFEQAGRLAAQLREAEAALAEATRAAELALARAAECLARGEVPDAHEAEYAEHQRAEVIQKNRAAALRRLHQQEEARAERELVAALEEERRRLFAAAWHRADELSRELADAVAGLLPAVLQAKAAVLSLSRDAHPGVQATTGTLASAAAAGSVPRAGARLLG